MPAPTIVSSDPSGGETGVYKNKVLVVTFSTPLSSATVSGRTVYLKNLATNEIIHTDISLAGEVVTITPVRFLFPGNAYRLTLVGADTAVGTPIQSSTNDSLVLTTHILFSTGSEIEAANLQKTDAEIALEGEINLPSNIHIVADTSYLEITETNPVNREFAVEETLSAIFITFSLDLDSSTVNSDSVIVSIGPYYEEDEEFFAYPDTSDGSANWRWCEPVDDDGSPIDFSDLEGTLSVNDNVVVWTKTDTRNFPRNTKVSVVVTTDVESIGGSTLENDKKFVFYITPFPYEISVERVRDEFYPYILSSFTDDMIGKAIYKNSLDGLNYMRWVYDFTQKNRLFSWYILNATIVDIFEGIRMEQEMQAGQFKRLGDMAIRYDSDIGENFPAKMLNAIRKRDEFREALRGRWTHMVREMVKGRYHPEQRAIWRTRLWKQDLQYALEGIDVGMQTAGNTADIRATKVPGRWNPW